MHIRCSHCQGAIWFEMAQVVPRLLNIRCPLCDKEYRLERGPEADEAVEQLAERARQLVLETQVDLPSAYSVLLGVTTLDEVLELEKASAPAPRTPPGGTPNLCNFDSAFAPAVEAGLLTPLQALHRGNRLTYASLLRKKHGLTEELAFDVADNKISLLEAMRRRGPDPGPAVELTIPIPSRTRSSTSWWLAGGALALAGALALLLAQRSSAPTPAGSRSILGAEVRTDDSGRVLRVTAPDPRSVLRAYCTADRERRFEPVDLAPAQRDDADERLGLLRRTGRSGQLFSIPLHREGLGNRWVAGDGNAPLVPELVAERKPS